MMIKKVIYDKCDLSESLKEKVVVSKYSNIIVQ